MELLAKLFSFVPDELLENLAVNTKVNRYAKKLQGELVFKLTPWFVSHEPTYCRTLPKKDKNPVFYPMDWDSLFFSFENDE